jgi:hypothetical protein
MGDLIMLTVNNLIGFNGSGMKEYTIVISSNTTSFNLSSSLISLGADLNDSLNVNIIINTGIIVGSTSTSIPAISINLPTIAVNLINNGYIVGRGGNGSDVDGQAGKNGGNALLTTVPLTLTNNGTIGGGGGGGGKGAHTARDGGSRGGGGAGWNVGKGGAASPMSNTGGAYGGTNGTLLTGGLGGHGGEWNAGPYGGNGGKGGDLGQPGHAGANTRGGAAGYAIVGFNRINVINIGTTAGYLIAN